jgi:hypothetical protein
VALDITELSTMTASAGRSCAKTRTYSVRISRHCRSNRVRESGLKAAIMALYEDSFPTQEFDKQSIRLLRSFLLRPMADRRKK